MVRLLEEDLRAMICVLICRSDLNKELNVCSWLSYILWRCAKQSDRQIVLCISSCHKLVRLINRSCPVDNAQLPKIFLKLLESVKSF